MRLATVECKCVTMVRQSSNKRESKHLHSRCICSVLKQCVLVLRASFSASNLGVRTWLVAFCARSKVMRLSTNYSWEDV